MAESFEYHEAMMKEYTRLVSEGLVMQGYLDWVNSLFQDESGEKWNDMGRILGHGSDSVPLGQEDE